MDVSKTKILIVDDRQENVWLLEKLLENEKYDTVVGITEPKKAVETYLQYEFDLILLDIRMPQMDGFMVMQALKQVVPPDNPPHILVLTAQTDRETKIRALEEGALDFLGKPFDHLELTNRIKNVLQLRLLHTQVREQNKILEETVRERTRELHETRLEVIRRLGRAAEYRDNETGMHIVRISKSAYCLAKALGCDDAWCNLILHASPMHDVGKIGIPDRILLKPGKLEADEWEIMKTHVAIGGELLAGHSSELLIMARSIAMSHHEKWDGSGYPNGLKGERIPLEGRIVSTVDVFDALTSERPYKKAWSLDETLDFMRKNRGTHFQPEMLDVFFDNLNEIQEIKKEFAD